MKMFSRCKKRSYFPEIYHISIKKYISQKIFYFLKRKTNGGKSEKYFSENKRNTQRKY